MVALERVFTYGTLRRGERAATLMREASFVDVALTEPRFTLFDLGAYPAAVPGGVHAIAGELYDVSPELLAMLDRFEGVPELYRRERVVAGHREAWIYLMPRPPAQGRVLALGDWCLRYREPD